VLLASLAVLSCSAVGTSSPETQTPSGGKNPVAPTSSAQATQDEIVKKICQAQKVDVSVNKCGDFYSAYPTGFVVDAATEIFDKNGDHIDSCGGNRFFTSDQAREESEKKCAAYLTGCKPLVESCRSLR
jgi:hypothetical protein